MAVPCLLLDAFGRRNQSRVFPGRTYGGNRLQPILDHPEERPRIDEEGLTQSHRRILLWTLTWFAGSSVRLGYRV